MIPRASEVGRRAVVGRDTGEAFLALGKGEPADAALVERCLRNDAEAWEAIIARHRRRVFHIAYKFTGRHDRAEDLSQEIFLKVFRSLEKFNREADFGTWLGSVARNFCIDAYRAGKRERESVVEDALAYDHAPSTGRQPAAPARGPGPSSAAAQGARPAPREAQGGRRSARPPRPQLSGDGGAAATAGGDSEESNQPGARGADATCSCGPGSPRRRSPVGFRGQGEVSHAAECRGARFCSGLEGSGGEAHLPWAFGLLRRGAQGGGRRVRGGSARPRSRDPTSTAPPSAASWTFTDS